MRKTTSKRNDPLKEKSFELAVRIVNLYKFLTSERKEYVMSKQVLKSGTNPGAMVREAKNAESGMDFVHKLGVAQKETGETQYWLELLHRTNYLGETEFQSMNSDAEEVMKLIRSSILTKKKNLGIKAVTIIIFVIAAISFFN